MISFLIDFMFEKFSISWTKWKILRWATNLGDKISVHNKMFAAILFRIARKLDKYISELVKNFMLKNHR